MHSASFDIVRAVSIDDMALFHQTMRRIFVTPEDNWCLAELLARRDNQHAGVLRIEYSIIRLAGEPIGMRWLCIDTERKIAYCPYGGLLAEYRRLGLYPKILAFYEQLLAQEFKISIVLNDCQNPEMLKFNKEAVERLRFFQSKAGYRFISDRSFPYIRPYPSPGASASNSYDYIIGYKQLGPHEHLELRSADSAASVSLSDYRYLYLSLMRLDTGLADEWELREKLPAVAEFLGNVDQGLTNNPASRVFLLSPPNIM